MHRNDVILEHAIHLTTAVARPVLVPILKNAIKKEKTHQFRVE
jgi:hypothetical protein